MTESELDPFRRLKVHTSSSRRRAPYKPLLLLLALGRLARGEQQIVFDEAEEEFKGLARAYGVFGDRPKLEYPFQRLEGDGEIWSVHHPNPASLMDRSGQFRPGELRRQHVSAGFSPRLLQQFHAQPTLIVEVASLLLARNFPESLHDEIRNRTGVNLSVNGSPARTRNRDPGFASAVFDAWFATCAVCGLDLRLSGDSVGLEAAHIRWHAFGGPDELDNGLALCALHHRLFDRGAFTIDLMGRFRVSPRLQGHSARGFVLNLDGKSLPAPRSTSHCPRHEHLKWHHEQVFQGVLIA